MLNFFCLNHNQEELKALIEREHKKIDEAYKESDSKTSSKSCESKTTKATKCDTVSDAKAPNTKDDQH